MFSQRETQVEKKPKLDTPSIIKLASLLVVIIITYFLNATGAFAPGWIVLTTKIPNLPTTTKYFGIFKKSDNASGFVIAACITIIVAIASFLLTAFGFGRAVREIYRFGYSRYARGSFYVVIAGALVNIGFTVATIALIAKAVSNYNAQLQTTFAHFSLGYCAWLCVASVVMSFGIIGISMYVAIKDCVDEEEEPVQPTGLWSVPL